MSPFNRLFYKYFQTPLPNRQFTPNKNRYREYLGRLACLLLTLQHRVEVTSTTDKSHWSSLERPCHVPHCSKGPLIYQSERDIYPLNLLKVLFIVSTLRPIERIREVTALDLPPVTSIGRRSRGRPRLR